MSIIVLSSKDKSSGSNQEGTIQLVNQNLSGKYKLKQVVIDNFIYGINDTNNKIYFEDNSVDKTATITNGTYTATQLATELKTQMDTVGFETYTITFNVNTLKYLFSATGNFRMRFGSFTTNSARLLLGFNETDTALNTSVSSDNPVNLSPYDVIYFDIASSMNLKISNNTQSSFYISVNSAFGNIIRQNYEDENIELNFSNKTSIDYKVHDEDGNVIDLNNGDWSIILIKQ
jgi:hypothetical protein